MKLGIAVVYIVRDDNRWLWELHLSRIRRHTASVPYTLYAGVAKLEASLRARLEQEPNVVLLDGPAVSLPPSQEHTFYLTPLIRQAAADGCTHILTLHMDSFPVQDGWFFRLCERLTETQPLVVPVKGDLHIQCSASLFFSREFYRQHQPELLIPAEEKRSPAYRQFAAAVAHHPEDTGIGFLYHAYRNGLTWSRLQCQGSDVSAASFGLLFDGLFFHLAGAVRLRGGWTGHPWFRRLGGHRLAGMMRIVLRHCLPRPWRVRLYDRLLPLAIGPSYHRIRRALATDPAGFLRSLRRG